MRGLYFYINIFSIFKLGYISMRAIYKGCVSCIAASCVDCVSRFERMSILQSRDFDSRRKNRRGSSLRRRPLERRQRELDVTIALRSRIYRLFRSVVASVTRQRHAKSRCRPLNRRKNPGHRRAIGRGPVLERAGRQLPPIAYENKRNCLPSTSFSLRACEWMKVRYGIS